MVKKSLGYGSWQLEGRKPRSSKKAIVLAVIIGGSIIAGAVYFLKKTDEPSSPTDNKAESQTTTETITTNDQPIKESITVKKTIPQKEKTAKIVKKEKIPQVKELANILPKQKHTKPLEKNSEKKNDPLATIVFEAEKQFAQKKYEKTLNLTSKAIKKINGKNKNYLKLIKIFTKTNFARMYSKEIIAGKTIKYKIKDGDALQKIARKFGTTVRAIQLQNNMKKFNFNIFSGQTLKIYKADWRIVVDKLNFLLMLFDGNELFAVYNIALGKNDKTPLGSFYISSRKEEPDWYPSKGLKIPFGDERNVLGTRWMALKTKGQGQKEVFGYGIHGTWERDSIGKMSSNGCIRMLNENIEELFDIIPNGTSVEIIETVKEL